MSFTGHVPSRQAAGAGTGATVLRLAVFTSSAIVPVEGSARRYHVRDALGGHLAAAGRVRLPDGREAVVVELGGAPVQRFELCGPGACRLVEVIRLD